VVGHAYRACSCRPLLRAALELHVEWAADCFDGDGDGLYHAYINTWPTDSVWFNGGAAPEESGYMCVQ
jgi:hypothetical protein